jgi:UDP-apiose/xylose synthase
MHCVRRKKSIGSPYNEISIRQMAGLMREIYAEKFGDPAVRLPDIVTVTGEEFYGKGYDDSDRRIPDIAKVRTLLNWEPRFGIREILETTMRYYVSEYRKNGGSSVPATA